MPKKKKKVEKIDSKLATVLRHYIEESGKSTTQIGREVLSPGAMSLIMNGHIQNPRIDTLFKICHAMEAPAGTVISDLYKLWQEEAVA